MFQSIDILVFIRKDMSQPMSLPNRSATLRRNSIVEILTQMGWNFKPLFDQAYWDGESSWLTLETIQTCLPEASAIDMTVLMEQGRVKASEHGFARVRQSLMA